MKPILLVFVLCMVVEMALAAVTFINKTKGTIHVSISVSFTNSMGTFRFYDIPPGGEESWGRSGFEVAYMLRDDNEESTLIVVRPNTVYIVTPEGYTVQPAELTEDHFVKQ
ncbi:hypothetical protein BGZ73_000138 [Actinomortierella ambigua]|nr:hypothetical protein BGZ73_000138 [Actinomortierella ambigua]